MNTASKVRGLAYRAGAGTGKTHQLVERYLELLNTGLRPIEIVAVTFTDRAALEFRNRLRERLGQLPHPDHLVAELEAAPIGTIHSLAARISREFPEEAEVPADFQVLDDLEATLLRAAWVEVTLQEALEDEGYAPLVEAVGYEGLLDTLERALQDPLAARKLLEEDPVSLRERLAAQAWSSFARRVEYALIQLEKEMATPESADGLASLQEALERVREILKEGPSAWRELASLVEDMRPQTGKGQPQSPSLQKALNELKTLVKRGKDTFSSSDSETPAKLPPNAWSLLLRLFDTVWAKVEERNRKARRLGYADLEVHALRALEHEAVRHYYQERFHHLLVDEFQDTNPVQEELLRKLFPNLDAWTVAGDPNQSIYGFRRADPKVFQGLLEEMGERVRILPESYRYHRELAQFHNAFFGELLAETYLPVQAVRDPLNPGPAVLYATPGEEAFRLIAREVQRLVAQGFRVRDGNGERGLRYGDVAVIAPKWNLLAKAAEALHEAGIPAVEAKGGNLLETREFEDAFLALRFLADPEDEEALVGLLRAPFFALSDPELRQLAEKRGKSLWEVIPQGVKVVLEDLRKRKSWEPPSHLLQRLDMATGYTGVLSALPRGPRRVKDWEGVLALVRQLERGDEDPFLVVRKLRLLRREGVQVPRPPMEAGNAVTLITAHSAKGLEWPVVFLLEVGNWKGNAPWKTRAFFRPGLALFPPVLDRDGNPGSLFHLAKACLEQEEEAERRRLLYVAATRAAERLYCLLGGEANAELKEALERAGARPLEESKETAAPLGKQEPEAKAPGTEGNFCLEPLSRLPLESLPISLLALAAKDLEAARRRLWGGPPEGDLPPLLEADDEEGAGGPLVGTMVHALLEKFDQEDALNEGGRAFLESHYPEAEEEEWEEALSLAHTFLIHEAFAPYRRGEKEVPVVYYLELEEGETVALEGRADRVGPDWVLDYKTDLALDLEAYRLQVGLYALALGKQRAFVADLRQGKVEEVSLEEVREATAWLIQALRQLPKP
ncbi:UvrD-helicase domain-containing protein [Thermus hydrothermalis]|uniref:UvrD-helicase domain-containing protein n=1 Tax=Thermus hydrothermalis TaxID=2908148 RepID=UPI0024310608|nr:UvrD-helicase domain-containing protein [Thermus hydrothermalis]